MATRPTKAKDVSAKGFSAAEQAAMKARAKELKAEQRAGDKRRKGEAQLLSAIEEMPPADQQLATKIHAIVGAVAPQLFPKTWYGMPAWANEDGKVVCFFKAAAKFENRYAELGFNEDANLDDGAIWPTVFAVTRITKPVEQQLRELVARAVS
jgi:uncharacterized protein YdhG (YjbR/CyaY superfamily)